MARSSHSTLVGWLVLARQLQGRPATWSRCALEHRLRNGGAPTAAPMLDCGPRVSEISWLGINVMPPPVAELLPKPPFQSNQLTASQRSGSLLTSQGYCVRVPTSHEMTNGFGETFPRSRHAEHAFPQSRQPKPAAGHQLALSPTAATAPMAAKTAVPLARLRQFSHEAGTWDCWTPSRSVTPNTTSQGVPGSKRLGLLFRSSVSRWKPRGCSAMARFSA
jgi:hypothetical protein